MAGGPEVGHQPGLFGDPRAPSPGTRARPRCTSARVSLPRSSIRSIMPVAVLIDPAKALSSSIESCPASAAASLLRLLVRVVSSWCGGLSSGRSATRAPIRRIAAAQMMVQKAQGLVLADRRQPQAQLGQLHRQRIQIDAINAGLRHPPPPIGQIRLRSSSRGWSVFAPCAGPSVPPETARYNRRPPPGNAPIPWPGRAR